jgi:hypothetical protein
MFKHRGDTIVIQTKFQAGSWMRQVTFMGMICAT